MSDFHSFKSVASSHNHVPCDPSSPCGQLAVIRDYFASEVSVLIFLFFSSFFIVFLTATSISLCVIWYRERGTRSALKAVRSVSNAQERDPMRNSLRNLNHPYPNNHRYIADCENGYRVNDLNGKCLNREADVDQNFEEVSDGEGSVRTKGGKRCTKQEKALSLTTFAANKSNSVRELNRRNSSVSDRTLFTNSSNESPPLVTRNYRVHHIFREVLMIERTFCKELELICSWVRDFFESELHSNIQSDSFMKYLSLLEPLSDIHKSYLEDLEYKFASSSLHDEDVDGMSLEASRFQSLTEPIISCLEVNFLSRSFL